MKLIYYYFSQKVHEISRNFCVNKSISQKKNHNCTHLGVFANFFFALTGSDAHLVAKVLGFALGFWGVLKPSEVGEGVHFLL